ncbi:MAG: S26 family signal peptidase [Methanosarcinaceae archaeon]|nr:S26 family signal peptidase [Methanosarcinaceae archaeon]
MGIKSKNKNGQKKKEEQSFFRELLSDLTTVAVIVGAFLILSQIFFGLWTPMVVIESGSMQPNMNIGDIVFIKSISRADPVSMQESIDNGSDYVKFKKPGDVILYRPYGNKKVTPIIHRAMYYVEEGEPMWEGGPAAPHAGYITKGDNELTNAVYDQQSAICREPVKKEWIIGTSQFRIPLIGKIRLLMPF